MNLTGLLLSAAVTAQPPAASSDAVVVEARRILPSVGLMNDHMHEAREFMIGLRYQHIGWSGANQRGTKTVTDSDLLDAGYVMRATHMGMDMAMLDLMYGVTDNLTVTVSSQYVWNRMTMVGIDPMGGIDGSMALGEVATEKFHGLGDTLASASLRLARRDHFGAHVTLGVWAPTGKSGLKNPDGTFTEYDMQTGSGTWEIEPSATIRGNAGRFGWGGQASYRFSVESRNGSGYRLGNRTLATSWIDYLLGGNVRATARAEFTKQDRIHGMYNGPASMGMPEDDPWNYGGDLLIGALGLNWKPALGMKRGPQLGVEIGLPLYQRVNGVQLPERWQLSAGIRHFF